MKAKKSILVILVAILLGASSCAQAICPAYAEVDTKEKKEKKEGQF